MNCGFYVISYLGHTKIKERKMLMHTWMLKLYDFNVSK
jgi:hypothetical protein